MSDELEPMRRAAELGCEDFKVNDIIEKVFIISMDVESEPSKAREQRLHTLPNGCRRTNRYAANVCECWWQKWHDGVHCDLVNYALSGVGEDKDFDGMKKQALEMIDICRAFANKYGN